MDTFWNNIGSVVGFIILLAATVWVFVDAKAIGDDRGQTPGLVNTKPGAWAAGVFLFLILVLPVYLVMRLRYKRLLAERKAQVALLPQPSVDAPAASEGVWPPPPRVAGPEPPAGPLCPVFSSSSPTGAHIVSGMLEDAGIKCSLSNEFVAAVDSPISNATGGVQVLVRASDVERANELLREASPDAARPAV